MLLVILFIAATIFFGLAAEAGNPGLIVLALLGIFVTVFCALNTSSHERTV